MQLTLDFPNQYVIFPKRHLIFRANVIPQNDAHPFIFSSMISYAQLAYNIWKATPPSEPLHSTTKDQNAFLDYQVQKWQDSLSPDLRLNNDQELSLDQYTPARNRLRVLFKLRSHHLRMLIYKKALLSSDGTISDAQSATIAIDQAKEIIRLLDTLFRTSDLYDCHRIDFNHFLYSALTVIVIAVYHAQSRFQSYCRDEFHNALNMICGRSAKSSVARKLWVTTKHMRVATSHVPTLPYEEIGTGETCPDPAIDSLKHRSTLSGTGVIGMGRATTASDADLFLGPPQYFSSRTSSFDGQSSNKKTDGRLLSSELSELFENIQGIAPETLHRQGPFTQQPQCSPAFPSQSLNPNSWNFF